MTLRFWRLRLKRSSIVGTIRSLQRKCASFALSSLLVIGATISVPVIVRSLAFAEGPTVKQPTCTATWIAPQFNTDGTLLHDLKEYRIYYGATLDALNAATTPFFVKSGVDPNPPGEVWTEAWPCASLPLGQGYITVTAVNMPGNESARAVPFPFVLVVDVVPGVPTNLKLQ